MFKESRFAALMTTVVPAFVLCALAAGALAAPKIPTEEEMLAAETPKLRLFVPPSVSRMVSLNYPVQFYLRALAANAESDKLRGTRSDVFTAGSSMAEMAHLARATQIGWAKSVADPKSGTLLKTSIALDVVGAVLGGPSDQDLVRTRWQELQSPSLYLVALRGKPAVETLEAASGEHNEQAPAAQASEPLASESEPAAAKPQPNSGNVVDQLYAKGVSLLKRLELGCEPAHTKSTNIWGGYITRGYYLPGQIHERSFLCGREGEIDIGAALTRVESRPLYAHLLGKDRTPTPFDEGAIAIVSLHKVDGMKSALVAAKFAQDSDPENLPRILYERVRDALTDEWGAVFTTKLPDGKRAIVVALGGVEQVFDMPEQPK
jgi:hypothetical protein